MKRFIIYNFSILFFINITAQSLESVKSDEEEYAVSLLNKDENFTYNIERNSKEETLVVSIGGACLAAIQIYNLGLRKAAYPFDVIYSDLDGIINAIKTDFAYFIDIKYLTRKRFNNKYHLYNPSYNFIFPHDLHSDNGKKLNLKYEREKIIDFQEKYKRRIARFKDLENFKGKVYFLRTYSKNVQPDTIGNLIKLRDLISKKFPKLNFEIIVVTLVSKEVKQEIPELIKYFYANDLGLFSKKAEQNFYNIFNLLEIKMSPLKPTSFFYVANKRTF
ncbi:MAG: DUF1796 family putative cysteine peptidase [Candidatus Babeliales bacterium]|nr:DUF1796 family putative cysteine peptidase [Candidatus Babeliales bacterium]